MVIEIFNKTKFSELKEVISTRPYSLDEVDAARDAAYIIGVRDILKIDAKFLKTEMKHSFRRTFFHNNEGFVDVYIIKCEYNREEIKKKGYYTKFGLWPFLVLGIQIIMMLVIWLIRR